MFLFGLLLGGFFMFYTARFDRLQMAALSMVGMAPTATPFASDMATLGAERYGRGDLAGAAAAFEQAVRAQPNTVSYLYEYGKVLIELDREEESIPLADKIISLAPNDPRGYALKATALMWADPAAAIPIAVNGLEANADFAPLHSALAIAYTNIGRYQEGLVRAQRAVDLAPLDANAHRAYAWPLVYVGRFEQAIDQLEEAISINPYLTSSYFELASYYRIPAINQPEMAVAIYNRILELEPDNAKAYLRLCETYSAEGEFVQGQLFCEQAIEIDPNYGSAYRELGRMQYLRRNYEGSLVSFQRCVDLGATDIECWSLRGLAHYLLGQCDLAWEVLQEALIRAETQNELPATLEQINIGLYNITQKCAGYSNRPLPTAIPPTPIPPTPIGGFSG